MIKKITVKKFILLNLLVSFLILISMYFISKFYMGYIDSGRAKFYIYETSKEKSKNIVILGNSHTRWGIKSDNEEIMNLALGSQSYFYDLRLLKKYSSKIKDEAIIIIPVSILSFYQENNEIVDNYIGILPRKELLEIENKEYYLKNNFLAFFPITNLYKIKDYMSTNFKNYKFEKELYGYPKDFDTELRLKENKKTVEGHLKIKEKKQEKVFNELLTYIYKKNWIPILVTTPFSYLYNEGIEKIDANAYEDRIYKNIEELEKIFNKDFIYLDYSHDKRFENNLEYFFDDDHLNEKGAEYFTRILIEDIKKLNLNR